MKAIPIGLFLLIILSSITAGTDASGNILKNLTEVGTFTTYDPRSALFFNDRLFIADSNSLLIYNISNPEKPRQVRKITDFGNVYGLSVSGDTLYAATGSGWMYVFDISAPENPKRLYQITYLGFANDVAVSDEYMYVADANTGMLIFNLSNKREPVLAGRFYIVRTNASGFISGWGGMAVAVSGRYAFLSGTRREGFYIIDVSNASNPKELFHSAGKNVYDIAASGNYVYLARADGTPQFEMLYVSNPHAPNTTGTFSINDIAEKSAIAVHPSGYIYAAAGGTWHIFKKQDTTPPSIIIEKPVHGKTFTHDTIIFSGRAGDTSGIMEVLVNGEFAGKEKWSRTVTLLEGANSITITASDKNGNSATEIVKAVYSPAPTETPPKPAIRPAPLLPYEDNTALYGIAMAIVLIYFVVRKMIR